MAINFITYDIKTAQPPVSKPGFFNRDIQHVILAMILILTKRTLFLILVPTPHISGKIQSQKKSKKMIYNELRNR